FWVCSNSKPETRNSKLLHAVRLVTAQRKILSQGVTLPIVGQQNSPQIRMPIEDHSEQIICFPFVPISRAPDAGNRRHMSIVLVQYDFQPNPVARRNRKEMIVDFKARLLFRTAIEAAKIGQAVELETRRRL